MEKNDTDGWPAIREPGGGLAEVSAVRSGKGRQTIRLGNVRLGDVVTSGRRKLLEFKGSKRDPVRVELKDLIEVLDHLGTESE